MLVLPKNMAALAGRPSGEDKEIHALKLQSEASCNVML